MTDQLDREGTLRVDPTAVVGAYWHAIDARDWQALRLLLSDAVVYDVPQTRERVRGIEAIVRFNAEFPGDWSVAVERVVADIVYGASWISFTVDGAAQPGITFFDFDEAGRIAQITDFWPDPYEPPPGRAHLVERF